MECKIQAPLPRNQVNTLSRAKCLLHRRPHILLPQHSPILETLMITVRIIVQIFCNP